jgi:hypothetical protein
VAQGRTEHTRAAKSTGTHDEGNLSEHGREHLRIDVGERQQCEVDDVVLGARLVRRRSFLQFDEQGRGIHGALWHLRRNLDPRARQVGRRIQHGLRHRPHLDELRHGAVGRVRFEAPDAGEHRLDDSPVSGADTDLGPDVPFTKDVGDGRLVSLREVTQAHAQRRPAWLGFPAFEIRQHFVQHLT